MKWHTRIREGEEERERQCVGERVREIMRGKDRELERDREKIEEVRGTKWERVRERERSVTCKKDQLMNFINYLPPAALAISLATPVDTNLFSVSITRSLILPIAPICFAIIITYIIDQQKEFIS